MLKQLNRARHAAVGAALYLPFAVFAQTDPVTTAVTDATTKVTTYATALVGIAAVGVGFMIGIKYIKKIVRAA